MRPKDIVTLLRLSREVSNPWESYRFRRQGTKGSVLEVRFRDRPVLRLRGGCADHHMFRRIYLADEYGVKAIPKGALGDVLDLGGNVGVFSAFVAPLARRVITYEPVPENLDLLRQNVAEFDNVEVVPLAVSDRAQTLRLYVPVYDSTTGAFSAHPEGNELVGDEAIEVEAISLEQVFENHGIKHCSFMKIDVEGAEYSILLSTPKSVLERIARIHGEYHDVQSAESDLLPSTLFEFLEDHGFTVKFDPHKRKPNRGMFTATR